MRQMNGMKERKKKKNETISDPKCCGNGATNEKLVNQTGTANEHRKTKRENSVNMLVGNKQENVVTLWTSRKSLCS